MPSKMSPALLVAQGAGSGSVLIAVDSATGFRQTWCGVPIRVRTEEARPGRDQRVVRRRAFTREDAAEVFEQAEMRRALMQRDIGLVYRELMRFGLSQRLIAYYTMQSQSEISEVLTGRRISSYDVLERIYTGLHIPPGHMGMAYDLDTIHILGPAHPQWSAGLLGHQVITRRPAPAETTAGGSVRDPAG